MNTDQCYYQERIILPPIQSLVNRIAGANEVRPPQLVPRSCDVLDAGQKTYFQSVRGVFDRSFMDTNRSIPSMYPPPPPPPPTINVPVYGVRYHNTVPPTTTYTAYPPQPQNRPPATLYSSPSTTQSSPIKHEYPMSRTSTPVTTACNCTTNSTPHPVSTIAPPPFQPSFKARPPFLSSNYKFSLRLTPVKSQPDNSINQLHNKLNSLSTVAMALATEGNVPAITPDSLTTAEASRRNSNEKAKSKVNKKIAQVSFNDQTPALLVTIPKVINKEFVQVVQQKNKPTESERPTTNDSNNTGSGNEAHTHNNGGSAKSTIRKRKAKPGKVSKSGKNRNIYGHCLHCGQEETPEWRNGPVGKATLCNACGLFFKKLKRHFGNESVAIQYMQHRCLVNSEDRTMPKNNE